MAPAALQPELAQQWPSRQRSVANHEIGDGNPQHFHNILILYCIYIYIYSIIYFHVFGVEHPATSQFNESAFGSAKTSLGATQPFFAWTSSRGDYVYHAICMASASHLRAELYRNWLRRNRKMRHGRI